jgi:uncharacterized protein (DUF927 family)
LADSPTASEELKSDELKLLITEDLLRKRGPEAEWELLDFCENNKIKGDRKRVLLKYYKSQKEIWDQKQKDNDPAFREAYSVIITAVQPEEQFEQIKDHVKTEWVSARESDSLEFLQKVCNAFDVPPEKQKILQDFYINERKEYKKQQREAGNPEFDEDKSLYINDEIKEWGQYVLPSVENGRYQVDGYGVYRIKETVNETTNFTNEITIDVCRTPFVLCGVSQPLNESEVYFKVRFATFDRIIKEFWASQSVLLSKKELKTKFLAQGINCPENELLNQTMEYISLSIEQFGAKFKKEFSARRNGWNEDQSVFVIGKRAITAEGIFPVLSTDDSGYPMLEKKGTLEGWMKIAPLLDYDLIRFKFYDMFTAIINAPLGLESHVTDHWGNSGSGKTFSAQAALSAVGDPEGLTFPAKSTLKGILVWIEGLSDLCVLIDETSDAGQHIKDLVYPLTSNKGRVKSGQRGEREGGEKYRTTAMLTGEQPIRDHLMNAGQQYRVNELDDSLPSFEETQLEELKKIIRDNYGHIVDLFVQKVVEYKDKGYLQTFYDNCFQTLPRNLTNLEGRSRSIFAGIMTAGVILERVFREIGMSHKSPEPIVNKYFARCILENPVEDDDIRALRVVMDWVISEERMFLKYNTEYKDLTGYDKNAIYGVIDETHINIIGTLFTNYLQKAGYNATKAKQSWALKGIIESNDKNRKGSSVINYPGIQFRGISIIRAVAEEKIGLNVHHLEKREKADSIYLTLLDIVNFLTKINGEAEVRVIQAIKSFTDLEGMLSVLADNGRILRTSQTTYRSLC